MSAAGEKFPWRRVMFLGLGVLRLTPQAFWRVTLRELAAALGEGATPLARTRFAELMQEFPDHGQ